jgi:hypothetical protein
VRVLPIYSRLTITGKLKRREKKKWKKSKELQAKTTPEGKGTKK